MIIRILIKKHKGWYLFKPFNFIVGGYTYNSYLTSIRIRGERIPRHNLSVNRYTVHYLNFSIFWFPIRIEIYCKKSLKALKKSIYNQIEIENLTR